MMEVRMKVGNFFGDSLDKNIPRKNSSITEGREHPL